MTLACSSCLYLFSTVGLIPRLSVHIHHQYLIMPTTVVGGNHGNVQCARRARPRRWMARLYPFPGDRPTFVVFWNPGWGSMKRLASPPEVVRTSGCRSAVHYCHSRCQKQLCLFRAAARGEIPHCTICLGLNSSRSLDILKVPENHTERLHIESVRGRGCTRLYAQSACIFPLSINKNRLYTGINNIKIARDDNTSIFIAITKKWN